MDNFYKLWKHFKDQHDLNLLDSELFEIVREVNAYNEAEGNCIKPDVSHLLLSDTDIFNESEQIKSNIKILPFHQASFQMGARWVRDLVCNKG